MRKDNNTTPEKAEGHTPLSSHRICIKNDLLIDCTFLSLKSTVLNL